MIKKSIDIDAPPREVWNELADLGNHAEWMKDAVSIVFTSEQKVGVGTTMRVATKVGPLRTMDVLEVIGWTEGQSIEILHRGLVTGSGVLSVEPRNGGSRVRWEEDLHFPWWVGGRITAFFARPVLSRIWAGNLKRLAGRVGDSDD